MLPISAVLAIVSAVAGCGSFSPAIGILTAFDRHTTQIDLECLSNTTEPVFENAPSFPRQVRSRCDPVVEKFVVFFCILISKRQKPRNYHRRLGKPASTRHVRRLSLMQQAANRRRSTAMRLLSIIIYHKASGVFSSENRETELRVRKICACTIGFIIIAEKNSEREGEVTLARYRFLSETRRSRGTTITRGWSTFDDCRLLTDCALDTLPSQSLRAA